MARCHYCGLPFLELYYCKEHKERGGYCILDFRRHLMNVHNKVHPHLIEKMEITSAKRNVNL